MTSMAQEETTYKMEPSTKREGTIAKGTYVTLYYKDQNHERMATEVKAEHKKS